MKRYAAPIGPVNLGARRKELCMKTIDKDPVCGMAAKESGIHTTYQGKKVSFCSEECKVAFEKDPGKYIK
jgi:YHS domain-containing protein